MSTLDNNDALLAEGRAPGLGLGAVLDKDARKKMSRQSFLDEKVARKIKRRDSDADSSSSSDDDSSGDSSAEEDRLSKRFRKNNGKSLRKKVVKYSAVKASMFKQAITASTLGKQKTPETATVAATPEPEVEPAVGDKRKQPTREPYRGNKKRNRKRNAKRDNRPVDQRPGGKNYKGKVNFRAAKKK
jgi:hypothetical protein